MKFPDRKYWTEFICLLSVVSGVFSWILSRYLRLVSFNELILGHLIRVYINCGIFAIPRPLTLHCCLPGWGGPTDVAMWQIINQSNKNRSRLIIQFGRQWGPATSRDGSLGVILKPLSSLLTSTAVPQDPPGPKHNDIAGMDFSFITKT